MTDQASVKIAQLAIGIAVIALFVVIVMMRDFFVIKSSLEYRQSPILEYLQGDKMDGWQELKEGEDILSVCAGKTAYVADLIRFSVEESEPEIVREGALYKIVKDHDEK